MTGRTRYNFYIDQAQRDGLRFVKQRDGILESEQIRRAIDQWLADRGVKPKATRTRRPRKRADR